MVKITRDKSQLSSHSRPRPTENAGKASVPATGSTSPSTFFTPTKKSNSSKVTPTRSSIRRTRPTAKVAAIADTSDSDLTPPASITPKSSTKRNSKKGSPRKSSTEKMIATETEVIDLTAPRNPSPKPSRKRPKFDRRLSVDLDSFINLCSDEDINSQPPQKKRREIPAEEIIFVSSGDEAEVSVRHVQLPRGQLVECTSPSVEYAAEAQVSAEEHSVEHSPPDPDLVVSDTGNTMEMCFINPDASTPHPTHTPPPVSPLDNDSAGITASRDMMDIEEDPTPKSSQRLVNTLHQESLQNTPTRSLTSEESHPTPFCNTPVFEPKQPSRKIVYTDKSQSTKPALLTSLFFARAMKSLENTRPKANPVPQSPNSLNSAALIESCVEQTSSYNQHDAVPLPTQNNVQLDPSASTIISLSTDTLRSADIDSVNMAKSPDITTHEDIRVSPAMEIDESEVKVFSAQVEVTEHSNTAVQSSCEEEFSAEDVLSMETVGEEHGMMETCDTLTSVSGQADDCVERAATYAEAGFADAETMQKSENQTMPSVVANNIFRCCKSASPIHTPSPNVDPPSRDPSLLASSVDSTDSAVETLSNSRLRDTSPSPTPLPTLQTLDINSSIFELEHLPNLTLQVLVAFKTPDDDSDLAISLPCYPERIYY